MIQAKSFGYVFSETEIKYLALFFRKADSIPNELSAFKEFTEKYIYNSMTIEEAERFFSEH